MNYKEIMERFGFSKNFQILLFIQSILVIVGFLFAINSVCFYINSSVILLVAAILALLTYISVIVYSFAGFDKGEIHYVSAVVLFLLFTIVLVINTILGGSISIWSTIIAILLVYFLFNLNNYNKARIAIVLVVVIQLIILFLGTSIVPWYTLIRTLILPCTIALTYEARYKRGLYDKK